MILAAVGCTGPAQVRWAPTAGAPDAPLRVDGVPFFPQKAYQCGPAAMAMALAWSGVAVTPEDLVGEVYTASLRGSLQPAMVAAARRHDRVAYLLRRPEDLLAEIDAGNPVIVLQNLGLAWYPVWHYAVVVGWDPSGGNVILHSGSARLRSTAVAVFDRTWARSGYWALLVLPASRLPASATPADYLRSVSALERMGRWAVAESGYRTALARWPDSLAATMGLGVCQYRAGDPAAAEATFRTAIARFPGDGTPYNNLAQLLADQGRIDEASMRRSAPWPAADP